MHNDLIERLQKQLTWLDGTKVVIDMTQESADAIEKLEAENAALRLLAKGRPMPIDVSDLTAQIEALKAEILARDRHDDYLVASRNKAQAENAQLKAELAATKEWSRLNNDAAVDMGKQCRELAAELAAMRDQNPFAWYDPSADKFTRDLDDPSMNRGAVLWRLFLDVQPSAERLCSTCAHFKQGNNPLVGVYDVDCFECKHYYASKWEKKP